MPDVIYSKVSYSLNEEEFISNLDKEKEENPDFNFLEVLSIPSAQNAIEFLAQTWFKSIIHEHDFIFGLNLRIDEKIDENLKERPYFFEYKFREFFIISFQSSLDDCESMTFWIVPGREKFYSTFIDDDKDEDILLFFHEFLTEELSDNDSGIMSAFIKKDEILLHEIGTAGNSNLLMMAASWGNFKVVHQLLNREFDVDYNNSEEDMAIDKAWTRFIDADKENRQNFENIILCLLNANSVFPKKFNYDEATQKIKDFVDVSESLFRDVKKGNFDSLDAKMKEHPNLIHFYNRKNKSLLLHALETRKFKIIDYLESGLNAGAHETLNFSSQYKALYKSDLLDLRQQHKLNALELPKTYLLILRSKTKIGNNDQLAHVRRKNVEDAYDTLDKDSYCSLLLQVAAQVGPLKIYFDFKHDSVYYLNPLKKATTLGTTMPDGTMYIGAKQLMDDSTKNVVLSTLSHEFCHLAVLVSYMNPSFDPFPMGESDEKEFYIKEVMKDCRQKQSLDSIVSNAFRYDEKLQPSELIVTVAEMLMRYINEPEKNSKFKENFKKLVNYTFEVVEPELEKALPVLRKLQDPEINIKYDSLTEAMKKSISHLPINLQGVQTTFYDLFRDDDSCLKLLTPENIRDIFFKGKHLQINEICTLNLKYSLIDRNFIDRATYQKLKASDIQKYKLSVQEKSKPIMEIRDDPMQSKSFILADYAGTGKTTIFKDSAIKIKQKETKFWVSYINLRKFQDIFKNYEGKLEKLSASDVGEILLHILQIHGNKFEEKIFQNLLKRKQVVLMFDGVDEICPMHTDILMKTFTILNQYAGSNEFWISTRPHYAAKIMEIFAVSPITFVLYTQEQKVEFIKEILTKNGITDETEQTNAIGQINAFIFHLNWEPGFFSDPDHPLIIEIISEIYCAKREIKLDATSHYALYEAMIEKQKEKVGDKIPNVERDPFSDLSVWHAHQVLAILVIIGDLFYMAFQCVLPDGTKYNHEFDFTLEDLSIIKSWRRERKNGKWTSDMIQRYGFVTVNLDNLTEDRSCIDFSHRTYAEFFVAKFLIDFLFNNNFDDEEMYKMMRILQLVQGTLSLGNVAQFIFSFMKTVARKEERKFHKNIHLYFDKRIDQAVAKLDKEPLVDGQDPFIFFGKLVAFDDELVTKLWGLNKNQNSLQRIILSGQLKNLDLILDAASFILGDDWHEKLNKSGTKLITNEEINEMKDKIVESWDDWKKDKEILKFCDFLHKNFDHNIQRQIHDDKVNLLNISNNKIRIEVIKIMSEIYDKDSFTDKCLNEMYFTDFSGDCLEFILNQVEKLNNNDREPIKKILFDDLNGESSLMYKAIISRNSEVLSTVYKYYIKYQDEIDEIQDILLDIETSEILKSAVESKLYPNFKRFIEDLFKDNIEPFKEKIEEFIENGYEASNDETYNNIKDFICFLFSDGEDKVQAENLMEYVDTKEPSENYGFGYQDESYEDSGWNDRADDFDDNEYTGDSPIDIVMKKSKKLVELSKEMNDINCLFPDFYED